MLHKERVFQVLDLGNDIPALVEKLTEHTWCGCNAFQVKNPDGPALVFCNDSFSGDGAQEYAVFRDGTQIESLTVSWMKPEKLKELVEEMLAGRGGTEMSAKLPRVDHGREPCYACR